MKRRVLAYCSLLVGAVCVSLALLNFFPTEENEVQAADHTDAPIATNEARLDITDIYAFRPATTDDLCVAMCVAPQTGMPLGNAFDNDGTYTFFVDNTGDNDAEARIDVTFSGSGAAQQYSVAITGVPTPITGTVGNSVTSSGIQVFCGMREDPFFFDFVGFSDFVASPYTPDNGLRLSTQNGTPADTFAGANVAAIVIQLPIVAVNGTSPADPDSGTIRAWAKTYRN